MIPAFTPHLNSGDYHYPLDREHEDPFVECDIRFKANAVTATLTQKHNKAQELFYCWLTVQYFLNPKFREVLPHIKPTIKLPTCLVSHSWVGCATEAPSVSFKLDQDAIMAALTKETLADTYPYSLYFSRLKGTEIQPQQNQYLIEFVKPYQLLASGTQIAVAKVKTYCYEVSESFSRYFDTDFPTNPIQARFHLSWNKYVKWVTPGVVPTAGTTLEKLQHCLTQPPTQDILKAFTSLLSDVSFPERPTQPEAIIEHAGLIYNFYQRMYGNIPKAGPLLAYRHKKIWHVVTASTRNDSRICSSIFRPGFEGEITQTHSYTELGNTLKLEDSYSNFSRPQGEELAKINADLTSLSHYLKANRSGSMKGSCVGSYLHKCYTDKHPTLNPLK